MVLQCFLVILFSSHWFACIIALQASLHSSVHSTLAGSELYKLCGGSDSAHAEGSVKGSETSVDSYDVLAGCTGMSIGQWYLASYSWFAPGSTRRLPSHHVTPALRLPA